MIGNFIEKLKITYVENESSTECTSVSATLCNIFCFYKYGMV